MVIALLVLAAVLYATTGEVEAAEPVSPPTVTLPLGIELSNLQYSPKYGQRGKQTTLSVTATNLNGVTTPYTITVRIWPSVVGASEWEKEVILAPNEVRVVDLGGFTPSTIAMYQIKVDGLIGSQRVIEIH